MVTSLSTKANTRREEPKTNGFEKLLPLLDPLVVNAPRDKKIWESLDPLLITWFYKTVSKKSFFNTIALYAIVWIENAQPASPNHTCIALFSFLKWIDSIGIKNCSTINPTKLLLEYFGNPPQSRGSQAYGAYSSFQLYMDRYLETIPVMKRKELKKFLLPRLVGSKELTNKHQAVFNLSKQKRKKQVFPLIDELPRLAQMVKKRYFWLKDLEAIYQGVVSRAKEGQLELPHNIHIKDIYCEKHLIFRVWDRKSWVLAHLASYDKQLLHPSRINRVNGDNPDYFLQYIGNDPDAFWFKRAVESEIFLKRRIDQRKKGNIDYRNKWRLPIIQSRIRGLLKPGYGLGFFIAHAVDVADGTQGDTKVIISIEPFLIGAAIGLLCITFILQTGMRIGELMQVETGPECMRKESFEKFDDVSNTWRKESPRIYFMLYPKGRTERECYLVTHEMCEVMQELFDLRERYCGKDAFINISAANSTEFSHSRRYKGTYNFILQWSGKHLGHQDIDLCMVFLLLEHNILDGDGKPIRITAHALRHAVAGYLRREGVPLNEIMELLHQINITVTDYYSKQSPDVLREKISSLLTNLMQTQGLDPALVRNPIEMITSLLEKIKLYGILRNTPGGDCGNFCRCAVQFQCASCPDYHPNPDRMDEINRMIEGYRQKIKIDLANNNQFEAANDKAILRDWKRRSAEAKAIKESIINPLATQTIMKLIKDNKTEEKQIPSYLSGLLMLQEKNQSVEGDLENDEQDRA